MCQELQHCWVFHAQQFPGCIKNGPPVNLTQLLDAFESTRASISVERFQNLIESMLQQTEAVLRAKGGATQF